MGKIDWRVESMHVDRSIGFDFNTYDSILLEDEKDVATIQGRIIYLERKADNGPVY